MNYPKFPVHLNNTSRRLRRSASTNSAHSNNVVNSVVLQQVASQAAYQPLSNSSLSNQGQDEVNRPSSVDPDEQNLAESGARLPMPSLPTVWLDFSDREMLLRQQAMEQAQRGQITEAIALFTLLIQYNPHSAGNYNNRGLLYFQMGDYESALMDYEEALLLNPRLAKIYNNRANCYAALGELDLAIADYEMAIDLDPTDIRAYLNQGITLRELNLFEQALESFDLALQFSQFLNSADALVGVPSNLEGHIYAERGRTYHYLGDWNCAVADYHRAMDRLPLSDSAKGNAQRLRKQVKSWMDELLNF